MKAPTVWWNETDDEISPVFAHFRWFLTFIFSSSLRNLLPVLFQGTIYLFNKNVKKDCKLSKIILIQGFCLQQTKMSRFPIGFRNLLVREYFHNYNYHGFRTKSLEFSVNLDYWLAHYYKPLHEGTYPFFVVVFQKEDGSQGLSYSTLSLHRT